MYEKLIKRVMKLLLDGRSEVLKILRDQYVNSIIDNIECTGKGMYVNFKINKETTPLFSDVKQDFVFGDVNGIVDGVNGAVGFILFIRNGYINTLECYCNVPGSWEKVDDDIPLIYMASSRNIEKLEVIWIKNM